MDKKNYELLEHTADIAVLVKADSLKKLFINSAAAMFEIISAPVYDKLSSPLCAQVEESGGNFEELLVNWLNQLLFLSASREIIFRDFKITELSERTLKAEASGLPMSACEVHIEVKAATYHELKVSNNEDEWQAKIIFDV